MAAQVDLVRVKVEEKPRDSVEAACKEKKKKKKREHSPCTEKHPRPEKEAKKMKLHHQQHQPHHHQHVQQQRVSQQQQKKTSHGINFNSKESTPVQHRNHHHDNNHHHHGPKKDAPVVWPPRKATPLPHKPAPAPAPAPLFTFTPLKVAKAESRHSTKLQKHPENDVKLKAKKENAEVNVKVDSCKIQKRTGNTTLNIQPYRWNVSILTRTNPNNIAVCACVYAYPCARLSCYLHFTLFSQTTEFFC